MKHHQTYIAGVKFRPGAGVLLANLMDGDRLDLVPEDGNKYDANAVKIVRNGLHVGYVPRDLAAEVRKLIADGKCLGCIKRAGTRVDIQYEQEAT